MLAVLLGAAGCEEPGPAPRDVSGKADRPPAGTPTPAPTPTPRDAGGADRCDSPGLRVRAERPDAAMGLRAMALTLVNCTDDAVTVQGYPRLRVLDGDGAVTRTRIAEGVTPEGREAPAPLPVRLAPGEAAVSVLSWRNTVDRVDVPAVTAPSLEVTPAPEAAPQTVAPEGGLDLGTTGRLQVTPWAEPSSR